MAPDFPNLGFSGKPFALVYLTGVSFRNPTVIELKKERARILEVSEVAHSSRSLFLEVGPHRKSDEILLLRNQFLCPSTYTLFL